MHCHRNGRCEVIVALTIENRALYVDREQTLAERLYKNSESIHRAAGLLGWVLESGSKLNSGGEEMVSLWLSELSPGLRSHLCSRYKLARTDREAE